LVTKGMMLWFTTTAASRTLCARYDRDRIRFVRDHLCATKVTFSVNDNFDMCLGRDVTKRQQGSLMCLIAIPNLRLRVVVGFRQPLYPTHVSSSLLHSLRANLFPQDPRSRAGWLAWRALVYAEESCRRGAGIR